MSLISRDLRTASRSALAVPPVETSSHPSSTRPRAKATRPDLLETESRAGGISDGRWAMGDGRWAMGDGRRATGGDDALAAEGKLDVLGKAGIFMRQQRERR